MLRQIVTRAGALWLVGALVAGCSGVVEDPTGLSDGEEEEEEESDPTPKSDGATIKMSGSLALSTETSQTDTASLSLLDSDIDPTDLEIYCVTFNDPPDAATASVSDDGAFEVELKAANVPFGCHILSGGQQLGSMVFEDPSETDMGGNSQTTSQVAFKKSVNFGKINFNLATGEAVVELKDDLAKNVLRDKDRGGERFDFSGKWETYALDEVPDGYSKPCTTDEKECHGPRAGETLWINRLEGREFEPSDACRKAVQAGKSPDKCEGEAKKDKKYAIAVWKDKKSFNSCGEVTGVTKAQARGFGFDPLEDSGDKYKGFQWDDNYIDGWKRKDAELQWTMHACTTKKVTGNDGNEAFFHVCENEADGTEWHMDAGCKTADGKHYEMAPEDWMYMDENGTRLDEKNSKNFDGFKVGGNRVDLDGKTVTCKHLHKQEGDYGPLKVIAQQGTLCEKMPTGTEKEKLAQLKCYADGLWQNDDDSGMCLKQVHTNWTAKKPANFIQKQPGPDRAMNMHVFEIFRYNGPDSGSFRTQDRYFDHVRVNENEVICHIEERLTISMFRREKGDMKMEFVMETHLLDGEDAPPACLERTGGDTKRVQKFLWGARRI